MSFADKDNQTKYHLTIDRLLLLFSRVEVVLPSMDFVGVLNVPQFTNNNNEIEF